MSAKFGSKGFGFIIGGLKCRRKKGGPGGHQTTKQWATWKIKTIFLSFMGSSRDTNAPSYNWINTGPLQPYIQMGPTR